MKNKFIQIIILPFLILLSNSVISEESKVEKKSTLKTLTNQMDSITKVAYDLLINEIINKKQLTYSTETIILDDNRLLEIRLKNFHKHTRLILSHYLRYEKLYDDASLKKFEKEITSYPGSTIKTVKPLNIEGGGLTGCIFIYKDGEQKSLLIDERQLELK